MTSFMDLTLARRLERTEGAIGASFVETLRRLRPESAAEWMDFSGTYALFAGPGSPITQTFGLGVFAPATPELLEAIEAFFFTRGADADHEVSPLSGIATSALLAERGYRPVEQSTVLVRDTEGARATGMPTKLAGKEDAPLWIETSARGWGSEPAALAFAREMAGLVFHNPRMLSYFAERDGVAAATGSLGIAGDVALLAGASTVPEERGRGGQRALLAARLAEANARGCPVAMMCTEPGSTSQRNAERNGFRVAYTRTKWKLVRARRD